MYVIDHWNTLISYISLLHFTLFHLIRFLGLLLHLRDPLAESMVQTHADRGEMTVNHNRDLFKPLSHSGPHLLYVIVLMSSLCVY